MNEQANENAPASALTLRGRGRNLSRRPDNMSVSSLLPHHHLPCFPEPTLSGWMGEVVDPRPDGCPRCLIRNNEPIIAEHALSGDGYYALYACAACRHRWFTAWGERSRRG